MTTSPSQARHRSTPESTTSALVAAVASSTRRQYRRSAVIAASSGLLVTMGLPATAMAAPAPSDEAATTTASIPAVPAAPEVIDGIAVAPTAQVDLAVGALAVVDSSVAEKAEADRLAAERAAAEEAAARAEAQRQAEAATASTALASRGSFSETSSRSTSRSTTTASGGSSSTAPSSSSASTASTASAPAPSAGGSSALAIGQRYAGTPYVYGGSAPGGFDCSGFVQYVHRQMGISLPRTAAAQASAGRRVSAAEARPGDIVNFTGSGGVYHNGIYAGNGMMLDAPSSGKTVGMHKIWSSSVFFTRVG